MKSFALRPLVLVGVLASILASPVRAAEAPAPDLANFFRPFDTDFVTLSPDGRRVAYTERRQRELILVIRDLDTNKAAKLSLGTEDPRRFSGERESAPAMLSFLGWASSDRVVFDLNRQNVWSATADFRTLQRLGDVNTFAAEMDQPTYQTVGTEGLASETVMPPSALVDVVSNDQPIHIAALPRGDKFVYLEAEMKERGVIRYVDAGSGRQVKQRNPEGTPRVVLKVDAATGKSVEWGEAPQSEDVICDQDGHPRIARAPLNVNNSRMLGTRYVYAGGKGGKWQPLDDVLGDQLKLKFNVTPENQLGERSVPVGFDYDADVLYYASNIGRDTFGIYGLNLKTRQRTAVAIESEGTDLVYPWATNPQPLVFDGWARKLVGIRYTDREQKTRWLDPKFAEVQQRLDHADPSRNWEILEWDEHAESFLVRGSSRSEPGVYALFRPANNDLVEFIERAPWLDAAGRNPGASFSFDTPTGVKLTGYITLPKHPILKRPPLIVVCHDGPWTRDWPGYDRETQALAAMGFIVLQVNYRGSAGFGRAHLDALREAPDTAPVEDIMAALEAMAPADVDRRLIALFGRGYGGYIALRAAQLHPERFRCVVAIDAPMDLSVRIAANARNYQGEMWRSFFGSDFAHLREISPVAHSDRTKLPVMIIEADAKSALGGRAFANAAKKHNAESVFLSLSANEAAALPQAQAALFGKIREFLNATVYNYAVKIGAMQEIADKRVPDLPKPDLSLPLRDTKPLPPDLPPPAPMPLPQPRDNSRQP
jgi:pimeloyl-ACP methyl ester carboxylesterase